jgi:hypothetical protein
MNEIQLPQVDQDPDSREERKEEQKAENPKEELPDKIDNHYHNDKCFT